MTKVAVIIPGYNEEQSLPETLRGIGNSLTFAGVRLKSSLITTVWMEPEELRKPSVREWPTQKNATFRCCTQFCRKPVFEELAGYDPTIFIGEDVQFYWRLSKFAKRNYGYLYFVEHPKVITSARRFNKMSLWKTLLFTQPILITRLAKEIYLEGLVRKDCSLRFCLAPASNHTKCERQSGVVSVRAIS